MTAAFAGLAPLALMQPAVAYHSVVGGIVLVGIYGAAFIAAVANLLTKRRMEVRDQVVAEQKKAAGAKLSDWPNLKSSVMFRWTLQMERVFSKIRRGTESAFVAEGSIKVTFMTACH
ncbi:unnamed protein product [Polarella glacialis]|uniref:Uncharacterized protein n=1 Tax=Polarella glacialis TaxID=89957 RepID=A0A813GU34_POLGL|nr:unnamed protein product [Polarella glacialis]